ncbi:hypothetical protein [Niveispirillum irakense]|uniref:hypothetical protein n=1 Tax=Niveispirillum irakense TaxID=34011 RepID=UPI0004202CE6|nr:hypothetical protein [Niveispirillum irakense]
MTHFDGLLRLGEWNRPSALPEGLAAQVAGWPVIVRSPGGDGFLDERGLIRVSNRWNLPDGAFTTDQPIQHHQGWALGRLAGDVWHLLDQEPALSRDTGRALLRERAERLLAGRRWTGADLEALDSLLKQAPITRADWLAAVDGRERSLNSLLKLQLLMQAEGPHPTLPPAVTALLDAGPVLWLDDDAATVAQDILAHSARRMEVAAKRVARDDRKRGQDLRGGLADAARAVFPGIPEDVAAAVAARLAPAAIKLGRRPATQAIVDCVAELRLERWRQVVIGDPRVAKRLEDMQARGENNRARKRYRDQRALERVAAEVAHWRGDLPPVTSRWLGSAG